MPPWPREKLVRRHVPAQLRARGEEIETRVAEPREMLKLLRDKLIEEVSELIEAIDAGVESQIIEELADVREVIAAFASPYVKTADGRWVGNAAALRAYDKRNEKGDFTDVVMKLDEPVPMILHCPKCEAKHVDRGVFSTTHIHRSHLCSACGHVWKPFPYATVGVEDVAVGGSL